MRARQQLCSRTASAVATGILGVATSGLIGCGSSGHGPRPTPTPTVFPIAGGVGASVGVSAAWGSDRFLVTFSDASASGEEDVLGVRLTQQGRSVDSAPFLLSDFGDTPFLSADAVYGPEGIAFADGSFGVFLYGSGQAGPEGPPGEVVGFVSVPEHGAPGLLATGIDEQATFSMAQTFLRPPVSVISNGASFLAVYQRTLSLVGSFSVNQVLGQIVTSTDGDVEAQRVGPWSGFIPPVDDVLVSGSAPGVAINPAVTLAAWVQTSESAQSPGDVSTDVEGVFLTPEQATLSRLTTTEAGSQGVVVASDGAEFLVVWTATTGGGASTLSEVRALRVGPDGNVEPEGGFLVEGGGNGKCLGGAAYARGVYLVAWLEEGTVRGARVGTAGTDADVFTIEAEHAEAVALATDGERFLVVFSRVVDASSADVLGTFVAAD